jgi:mercuric ion binding protein
MKTIMVLVLFLGSNSSFAKGNEVTVSVKGMVCGFCAQGITKKFKSEASVESVDVSLEKKKVTLDLKEGQSLSDDAIQKILKDAGYNVEKIER